MSIHTVELFLELDDAIGIVSLLCTDEGGEIRKNGEDKPVTDGLGRTSLTAGGGEVLHSDYLEN